MTKFIRHTLVALALVGAAPANATIVSGTWSFSFSGHSGTFSFTGLDTTQSYTDSTAAGFSVSTNFDTTGQVNEFTLAGGILNIGGSQNGVNVVVFGAGGGVNDWALWFINPFPGGTTGYFQYGPASGAIIGTASVAPSAAVPEPATLALLGLGLAGLGFARRKQ